MKNKLLAMAALICAALCAALIVACNNTVHVTSVTLDKTEITLEIGSEETITATVLPDNATDKQVRWAVEPSGIVNIDNGKITAIGEGIATITATADYQSAECVVTVKPKRQPATGIHIDDPFLRLEPGQEKTLTFTVYTDNPDEAAIGTVTWTIEPAGIATVDSNGTVRALRQGTAEITASIDEVSAKCHLTVSQDKMAYELNSDGQSYYVRYVYSGSLTEANVAAEFNGKPVTRIGESAFLNCSDTLKSINLPATVTEFSTSSLFHCRDLEQINVAEDNEVFSTQEGVLYNKEKTQIKYVPFGIKGKVTVPYGVTVIKGFMSCTSLTGVDLPNSAIEIDEYAFSSCESLESIAIPSSVKSIGFAAFSGCSKLSEVIIPDSVEVWENNSFTNCKSLTSVTIPRSITRVPSMAFTYCIGLTSIRYKGTKAEWNALEKGDSWDSGTSEYTVYCED